MVAGDWEKLMYIFHYYSKNAANTYNSGINFEKNDDFNVLNVISKI